MSSEDKPNDIVARVLANYAEFAKGLEAKLARQAPARKYRPDGSEEEDPVALFRTVQVILEEAHRDAPTEERPGIALHRAVLRAEDEELRHGHSAGLIVYSITRGRGDPEAVAAAYSVVCGTRDEIHREKIRIGVEQLANYEITLTQFDKIAKGIVPPVPRDVQVPAADALPLAAGRGTLESLLADSGIAQKGPSLASVWKPFIALAKRPFVAPPPLYIENDMCLFEWGATGSGDRFECKLTRQFSLCDDDGAYDHMEHLSLTLAFATDDRELPALGSDAIWSGEDIDGWVTEVESLEAWKVIGETPAIEMRVEHSDV